MSDVVVTVPKSFGLDTWIAEGDAAGDPWSGQEWHYTTVGAWPSIQPGERVYIVYNGKLRGYSPLVRLRWNGNYGAFVRAGDAEAVTIEEYIRGFRGYRYRWWKREDEKPFPGWRTP